ncbi:SDR family oxidoreductase [SAR116 cluster bacterium]|nr:SDR family oxidoreductase [SAR116 cluster bacterium]
MKFLITGGAGYIGTTLIPYLLRKGHSIRLIDKFFFGKKNIKKHRNLEIIDKYTINLEKEDFKDVDIVIDMVSISNDPSGERFQKSTWDINWKSRVECCRLAKKTNVKKYILVSSCSIYGATNHNVVVNEISEPNPQTTYAKANRKAEVDNLQIADDKFEVIVLRLATAFGVSKRMRFDLAINAMTLNAMNSNQIPLMRDGNQWRPFVHVKDITRAIAHFCEIKTKSLNSKIFNIGSKKNVCQLSELGKIIKNCIQEQSDKNNEIKIKWYGDPDIRSYNVCFKKLEETGFKSKFDIKYGVNEILNAIKSKNLSKTPDTITLDWYTQLNAFNG